MSFTTLSFSGLDGALAVMGESFTLRNVTRKGIIDDVVASETFAAGGAIPSEPISITFKLATFSPSLTPGERVTARGRNYTVRQVSKDEVSYTLVCEHTSKR